MALRNRTRRAVPKWPQEPNRERAILDLALSQPKWGAPRVVTSLRDREMCVSVSGVRLVWSRYGLCRRAQRLAAAERRKNEVGKLVGVHGVLRIGGLYGNLPRIKGLPVVVQHTFVNTQSLLSIARVYPAYGKSVADAKTNPRGIEFMKKEVLPFFQDRQLSLGWIHAARSWEITPGHRHGAYKQFLDEKNIQCRILRSGSEASRVLEYLHQAELNEFLLPAIRERRFGSVEELDVGLRDWLRTQNEKVIHYRQPCFGRTAMDTFQANIGPKPTALPTADQSR